MEPADLGMEGSLDGTEEYAGASSTEDFWMFFSFSMILLVFVLMNYVNYLNSLVVKAPDPEAAKPEPVETVEPDAAAPESLEVHLIVDILPGAEQATYHFADDPGKQEYGRDDLQRAIAERLPSAATQTPLKVFVHAPGQVLYQAVFDASFAAWQVGESHPDHPLDVHLVYEERQP